MDTSLAVILERPGSISAGWPEMSHYPDGMSEQFDIWESFAYDIPPQISLAAGTDAGSGYGQELTPALIHLPSCLRKV